MYVRAESLKTFYVQTRYSTSNAGDQIGFFQDRLDGSISDDPCLLVVHSPYPELSRKEQRKTGHEHEVPSTHWGRGVGKTALLEAYADVGRGDKRVTVLPFLNVRDELDYTARNSFFEQCVVKSVLEEYGGWKYSLRYYQLRSLIERFSMFAHSSMLLLAAVVMSLLVPIGLKLIELVSKGPSQDGLAPMIQILTQYSDLLWLVCPVVLALWVFYFWADIRSDDAKKSRWTGSAPKSLHDLAVTASLNESVSSPEQVLQLVPQGKSLLLIIDDVDCIDTRSFNLLVDLFETAEKSENRHHMCLVLGYNPRNPELRRPGEGALPGKDALVAKLAKSEVDRNRNWWLVPVKALDLADLKGILWDFYQTSEAYPDDYSSVIEDLIDTIGEKYPADISEDTGLLLGFFIELDDRHAKMEHSPDEMSEASLLDEFDAYIHHDETEVRQTIDAIKRLDPSEGSLEFLKLMLAFQTHPVDATLMEELLKSAGFHEVKLYKQVLSSAHVGLVDTFPRQRRRYYRFRKAYLKQRLAMRWEDWTPSTEAKYCTNVFEALCDDRSLNNEQRWDPEQALKSATSEKSISEKAIEILTSQGLYYYQYYGHSDAGYALRFLGLEEGGALNKWLSLCEDVQGEDLWGFLYWNSTTRLNPYRHLKTSKLPSSTQLFSVPNLILNAATAYWITGRTSEAHHIIFQWKTIRSRLSSSHESKTVMSSFWSDSAQIDLLFAKTLLHRGRAGDWDTVEQLCLPYATEEPQARFYLANIRHYRRCATGYHLPPLRFSPDSETLEELLRIGVGNSSADVNRNLVRLRSLSTVCSAMWDRVPQQEFDVFDSIYNEPVDDDSWRLPTLGRHREGLGGATTLLTELIARPRARPQDLPPGGRAAEAELLFWEAIFLCHAGFQLALDIRLAVKEMRSSLEHGGQDRRLRAYLSLIKLIRDFVRCGLLNRDSEEQLEDKCTRIQKWVETPPENLPSDVVYSQIRTRIDTLYGDILQEGFNQAAELFAHASTIYQRLGHKQGQAEISFQRLTLTLAGAKFDSTLWQELLEDRGWARDEVGINLDSIRYYIVLAHASADQYMDLSVHAFQRAKALCSILGADLPEAVAGELAYSLGSLLANLGEGFRKGSETQALELMHEARRRYRSCLNGEDYVSKEDAQQRMLSIRWHLAELMRRKISTLPANSKDREDLIREAIKNCNQNIRETENRPGLRSDEMAARMIKGDLRGLQANWADAIHEYDLALEYFERQKDRFWVLQTSVHMFRAFRSKDVSSESPTDELHQRFTRVVRATEDFQQSLRRREYSPGFTNQSVFLEGCLLLGREADSPEFRRKWLLEAFDVYKHLGYFGRAILLDGPIRETAPTKEEMDRWQERLREASEQIDSRREKGDSDYWERVFAILQRYVPVQTPITDQSTVTPHQSRKLGYLRMGSALIEGKRFREAIEPLQQGISLIQPEEPEEVDFDLITKLRKAYRETRNHDKVPEIDRMHHRLKDVAHSRRYLRLANAYREKGWDEQWALLLATDVQNQDSRYYREAERLLNSPLARSA